MSARVCYVRFEDASSVGVALHLTNTVFIDRALIVVPVMDGKSSNWFYAVSYKKKSWNATFKQFYLLKLFCLFIQFLIWRLNNIA